MNTENKTITVGDEDYTLTIKRNKRGSVLDWHWELFPPGADLDKTKPLITGNTNKKNYIEKQATEFATKREKKLKG